MPTTSPDRERRLAKQVEFLTFQFGLLIVDPELETQVVEFAVSVEPERLGASLGGSIRGRFRGIGATNNDAQQGYRS